MKHTAEKSREKQSFLTDRDLCEAREVFFEAVFNPKNYILLTPGEFRALNNAFRLMEKKIVRYEEMSVEEFALEVHNRSYGQSHRECK